MSGATSKGDASSIWTPANIVTCVRVAAVPLWLLVAEMSPVAGLGSGWSLGVFLFFVALSLTDKLDGYLARSRNEVTTFGKFLDPIADKLVVVVALCFLLERGEVSSWVLLVIVAREFLVSGLRMVVASSGTVIAASSLGKGKTAVTMVAISALLLAMALPTGGAAEAFELLGQVLMVAAVVLTAWSGIDYFVKAWSYVVGER
ncbi:CDP-diacylglycerol--glycerol-3-phosphate 3-phosphatidyltransferase [Tractidigestivibacter scatoligenes]|uniref:CDP-diacylglycerol--glycerol-3-phosphate 3-phosphatidyltransferase n=1 Tax=Tractidigestivibacter scatoligenes TaxID=1299998 RepID=A0A117J4Q5_TRASO|nr:CDP-diacylglycerol--glycerol-3-phosphate 3-phosphatidyltransferase [Tractidigestivibacter scatoligenes]KUH58318.1 CDP-diacylglycerol--glycerol-3-phosphate 3-phosphatidyltransferase [Tractidigestivibacter scatoligenes]